MSTNRGDELLSVLRTRLLTVASLPAARAWQNQRFEPTPGSAFVEDGLVTIDTERRETGPSAWGRTTALYRVAIRVPTGTDAFAALSLGVAITDAFTNGATLTVLGNLLVVITTRTGPLLNEGEWYLVPVYLSVTFDHA